MKPGLDFPVPAGLSAGTGFDCHLLRLEAPLESEPLFELEPLPAEEDDRPVDCAEGFDSDLTVERAVDEEFELLRITVPEPASRGEADREDALFEPELPLWPELEFCRDERARLPEL